MSVVQEYRRQLTSRPGARSETVPLIVSAAAVFVATAAGALGWNAWAARTSGEVVSRAASNSAAPSPKEPGPREPVPMAGPDVFSRMSAAVAVAPSGARIGTRSKATFLGPCMDAMPLADMMLGFGGDGGKSPQGPAAYEAKFTMLDQYGKSRNLMALVGPAAGGPDAAKAAAGLDVTFVGDFVACTLAQPSRSLCDPNNRAAAVSYLASYFSSYEQVLAAHEKLPPLKRHQQAQFVNEPRHRRIVSDVEKHAKAGAITRSDVGLLAHGGLRALIAKSETGADICAADRARPPGASG